MSIFLACSLKLAAPFSCEALVDVVHVDGLLLCFKSHSTCHLLGEAWPDQPV